jgi:HEAT repeat protein
VPIVPSRSARIQHLLGRLASGSPAERDSAVAGLTLLGARVVLPLRAILPTAKRVARQAALEVLDRIEDHAALAPLLDLVEDEDEPLALRAMEAVGGRPDPRATEALAGILSGPAATSRRRGAALALVRQQAAGIVEALDPLVDRVVDEAEPESLRLAVLEALAALDPPLASSTLRPLLRHLAGSAAPALAARARALSGAPGKDTRARGPAAPRLDRILARHRSAAEGDRPVRALSKPGAVPLESLHAAMEEAGGAPAITAAASVLGTVGTPASIPVLHRALARLGPVRARGSRPEDADALRARVAVHRALCALGSRIALYDLREAIEARPARAIADLLEVAARIGDSTLVPSLARVASEDPALRAPCGEVFAAIARREKLRRTSASLKPVRAADRAALEGFFVSLRRRRG